MEVKVTHDGLSSEFVTIGYTFNATPADRWIKVLPTSNTHKGTYNINLRIQYTMPQYSAIYTDVNLKVTVLDCEIESTNPSPIPLLGAQNLVIIKDTTEKKSIGTKTFDFVPACDYPDNYNW